MATFFQEELERRAAAGGEIMRGWLLIGVSTAALIELVETSITDVALPHIQENLCATASGAAWVMTEYAIAQVITMPLTGMLGRMFKKKRARWLNTMRMSARNENKRLG